MRWSFSPNKNSQRASISEKTVLRSAGTGLTSQDVITFRSHSRYTVHYKLSNPSASTHVLHTTRISLKCFSKGGAEITLYAQSGCRQLKKFRFTSQIENLSRSKRSKTSSELTFDLADSSRHTWLWGKSGVFDQEKIKSQLHLH